MKINYNPNLNRLFQEDYRNKLKSSYNKVYLGNITFCTIFNINEDSVFNEHLDSYYENIGENSPLRFTRIDNYPLYNVEQLSLNMDWDVEKGLRPDEITLQVTVAPFRVKPTVGAFFILEHEDYKGLFKSTGTSEESNLDSDMASRITLKLTRFNEVQLDMQTSKNETYIFNRDISLDNNVLSLVNTLKSYTNTSIAEFIEDNLNKSKRYIVDAKYTQTLTKYIKGLNTMLFKEQELTSEWRLDDLFLLLVCGMTLDSDAYTLQNYVEVEDLINDSANKDIFEELLNLDLDNVSQDLRDFLEIYSIDIDEITNVSEIAEEVLNNSLYLYMIPFVFSIFKLSYENLIKLLLITSSFNKTFFTSEELVKYNYGLCSVVDNYFKLTFHYDSYLDKITNNEM